jgi:hypothetical protein
VVEMRRYGVDPASEVQIVGEVEVVQLAESLGDVELEQEIAAERVLVSKLLQSLADLSSFPGLFLFPQLGYVRIHELGIPFGDVTLLPALRPYLLDYSQHVFVDLPWNFGEIVEHIEHPVIICVLHQSFLNGAVTISHHISCLGVVTAYFGLQPRQRFDNGGN